MRTLMFVSAVGGHGGPVASLRDILPGLEGFRRVCVGPWRPITRRQLEAGLCEALYDLERPKGLAMVRAVLQLRRALLESRPRLVFANGLTEAALVAMALTALGRQGQVPVVVWVHNYELPSIAGPARRLILRKRFVRWLAVSELAADLARDGFGAEAGILPNPLSGEVLAEARGASAKLRVAYLGSDRPYKGFDYLRDIIERTRHLPLSWRLFLPKMDRPVWHEFQPVLDDPSLDVRVLGRVSPVSEAYAQADVVIVPSRQESFCRVAAEAMVNRLPVIASALSPLRGLLGDNEAGFLVPVGDTAGFAQALERLVADPALRAQMGEAGARRSARFEVDGIRERWRAEIERVLADG